MSAQIPVGAKVECSFRGTFEGDSLVMMLYKGMASDGYKSDFTRRPARWVVWQRTNAAGKRTFYRATRFGGRRFAAAPAEYAKCVAELKAAGVVEVTR